jgi:hypothetical protein
VRRSAGPSDGDWRPSGGGSIGIGKSGGGAVGHFWDGGRFAAGL